MHRPRITGEKSPPLCHPSASSFFFSSPSHSEKRSVNAPDRAILSRAAMPPPPRCSRRCRSILRTVTLCVVYHTERISTVSFTRFPRGDPFQSRSPFRPLPPSSLAAALVLSRDDACLIAFAPFYPRYPRNPRFIIICEKTCHEDQR